MDDIVKALTNFSVDSEASTADLESDDIIKALTDFSANSDTNIVSVDSDSLPTATADQSTSITTIDSDTLSTTTADQGNVVTVSYLQVNNLATFTVSFNRVLVHQLTLMINSCHRR